MLSINAPSFVRVGFAVLHRATVALINLGITIAAARSMSVPDFAVFTICITCLMWITVGHTAFVSEPVMLFAGRQQKSRLRAYFRDVRVVSVLVSSVIAALVATMLPLFFPNSFPASVSLLFGALVFFALLNDISERCLYSLIKVEKIFLCSVASAAAALLYLWHWGSLQNLSDALLALLIVYVTAVILGSIFIATLDIGRATEPGFWSSGPLRSSLAASHISYGKWIFVAQLSSFGILNLNLLLISIFGDLVMVAEYRIVTVFVAPLVQAFSAIGMIALPLLRDASEEQFAAKERQFIMLIVAVSFMYGIFIYLFSSTLQPLFFGDKYVVERTLLLAACCSAMLVGLTYLLGTVFRVRERQREAALLAMGVVVITAPVSALAILNWGLYGALLAWTTSSGLLAGLYLFRLNSGRDTTDLTA